MSGCKGLHCPGCGDGPGRAVPLIAAAVLVIALAEWILSALIWIAIALGAVLVIAAAALAWWVHGKPARQAAWDARYAAAFGAAREREAASRVTATVIPRAGAGARPAVGSHVIHHHVWEGPAIREPARIARSAAIPADAGEITEGESWSPPSSLSSSPRSSSATTRATPTPTTATTARTATGA